MNRHDIITTIGQEYLVSNLENGEFSYPKALKKVGKTIDLHLVTSSKKTKHSYLDIRFVKDNISILVETKDNFDNWDANAISEQLQAYVNYENELTGNKIIAILANTSDERIKVWWGSSIIIDDSHKIKNQYKLKTFKEYAEIYSNAINDREQVVRNTYFLNETLHRHGINEKIRSQFVGTCLLALKNDLVFENLTTKQILGGIEEVVVTLLNDDLNKAYKLGILKNNVIDSQDVRELKKEELQEILRDIKNNILPYINDKSTMGQDILNLFFTTFNKYVGKADKNQAFTPDHIVHFMCQAVGVNRNSKVLDPCCGSGSFLVRAMTEIMDDCANDSERDKIKKQNIFGIEFEETAFGLSTTNMLIHGDGNSNVKQGSCFDLKSFISDSGINVVLMNPPYNAQRKYCLPSYVSQWGRTTKEDPSQGFHYVYHIASYVKTGKLAVLLPMQCAIGTSSDMKKFKKLMLEDHTLDAVFSLPTDIFHPGANASACCMIFNLGTRHKNSYQDTFFGYFKEDGFTKKKNLGRIEKTKSNTTEGVWADIESYWLELYRGRKSVAGISVTKKVSSDDEWLAEAYMETNISNLDKNDFSKTVREYLSYLVKYGLTELSNIFENPKSLTINTSTWKNFYIEKDLFTLESCKCSNASELIDGDDIFYIGAKKTENGVMKKVSHDINLTSKGNCIIFICDGQGSVGYTNYMESDFIGSTTLTAGYNKKLNKYNGLFIVTVLDLERPKYSFGRKYKKNLSQTSIKLPSTKTGKPDWDFMQEFVKQLPYSNKI